MKVTPRRQDFIPHSSQALVGCVFCASARLFLLSDPVERFSEATATGSFISETTSSIFRLCFASIIFADCLFAVLYGDWDQKTEYEPCSKLQPITLEFRGYFRQPKNSRSIYLAVMTMSSFTMVSWMLLGISFLLSGLVGIDEDVFGGSRSTLASSILWMAVAPTTLLVSTTVKYVLWPSMSDTTIFRHPLTLLEHNGNTIMVLFDLLFLSNRKAASYDIFTATTPTILLGAVYVLFSWRWRDKWAPTQYGPQFLYPFFDTTLPEWKHSLYLFVLMVVLHVFSILLTSSQLLIESIETLHARLIVLLALVLLTCRWTD